jgi:dTDP-4-amino-4,6-dideoxygalactose transaminase
MAAVLAAMADDRVGPGEGSRMLVQSAREYLEFDHALALRSPARALFIALESLSLSDGDGVLVSALAPRYYAQVLSELRLRPVFCDTAPGSACTDAALMGAALAREGGRCIVASHSLGFVPDMEAICGLGLPVIEDISQSYGGSYGGKPAGSLGQLVILGLEEQDMLTAGGGALLYAPKRREAGVLRGLEPLSEYSLPDLNAAMAAVQFKEAPRNLERRRAIAQVYLQAAQRTRHRQFQSAGEGEYNNYAFPLILETGMKDVKAYAKKKDIVVESAFDSRSLIGSVPEAAESVPEAWSLSLRTALFPLYPRLGSSETEKIAKLIMTLP